MLGFEFILLAHVGVDCAILHRKVVIFIQLKSFNVHYSLHV